MCISEKEIKICRSKRSYKSLILADAYAEIISYKHPESPKQRPYYCKLCCKYHLTCGQSNIKEMK